MTEIVQLVDKTSNNNLKETLTNKLLELNEHLVQYNKLIGIGLSKDHVFEKIMDAKKEIIEDIIKVIK
jgi:hypothetical protein